jgi:hypothetical protein
MSDHRTPTTGPGGQRGATPVSGGPKPDRRKRGLLFGALLVAALVALALLLSQCLGSDPEERSGTAAETSQAAEGSAGSSGSDPSGSRSASGSASGSASASASASGSAGAPAGGAGGQGQIVTGDGRPVLELAAAPDAAGALAGVTGQPVTATGVRVLSVPADEGFWVGASDTQRVWVQLTGDAGESPYQVQEGDAVDFEGTVVAHDAAFAQQVGVDEAEGAAQLAQQAQHLEVAKNVVRLTS